MYIYINRLGVFGGSAADILQKWLGSYRLRFIYHTLRDVSSGLHRSGTIAYMYM